MEDLHFKNNRQFNDYLSTAKKFSNQGRQGIVYRKDGIVIKDFGVKPKIETDHILQFRDLKLDDFFFPLAGIYIRTELRACITEYAPGLSLEEQNIFAENMRTVLRAIQRLEDAIKEASKAKVRLFDTHSNNILFDIDHFNFIDTISYYYSPMDYDDLYRLNIKCAMMNINMNILPKILYNYQKRYKGEEVLYHHPHECLEEMIDALEGLIGHFDSFDEATKIIETQKIILPGLH